MSGFNYKKAVQLLAFFASKSGGAINKMKAIKLVWLCDRYHLRQYGRSITGDIYFALPYGPVASTTRDLIESNELLSDLEKEYANQFLGEYTKYNYSNIKEPNYRVLSETELKTCELILSKFGHFNEFQLSELSHTFPEWKKYESALKKKISSRFSIDLSDFFLNVDEESGIFIEEKSHIEISMKMYQNSQSYSAVLL